MKRRSYSGYTSTMLEPLKGKFDIHFIFLKKSNENFKTYFYVFLSLTETMIHEVKPSRYTLRFFGKPTHEDKKYDQPNTAHVL